MANFVDKMRFNLSVGPMKEKSTANFVDKIRVNSSKRGENCFHKLQFTTWIELARIKLTLCFLLPATHKRKPMDPSHSVPAPEWSVAVAAPENHSIPAPTPAWSVAMAAPAEFGISPFVPVKGHPGFYYKAVHVEEAKLLNSMFQGQGQLQRNPILSCLIQRLSQPMLPQFLLPCLH
jgi:hypothetical protein